MDLIARAQAIILKPKEEWVKIKAETDTVPALFTKYAVPLAAIPAAAQFIGFGLVGRRVPFVGWFRIGLGTALMQAILTYVLGLASIYLFGLVINALAPNFGSKPGLENAMKLAVYAMTPMWIGGVFYIIPFLSFLSVLASLYGLYILYLGFSTPMMDTPQEKILPYLVVSIIVVAVLTVVVSLIVGAIFAVGTVYTGL